jgi:DNA-binding transcriptional regulator LsrR (DeoR family)
MSGEFDILFQSRPPEPGSPLAEFERQLPDRGRDCPLTADLIRAAEGKAPPELAAAVAAHAAECAFCRRSVELFGRALDAQGLQPAGPADLPPAAPAQARRLSAAEVARLFLGGAPPEALVELTSLSPRTLLRALCRARDRGLIAGVEPPRPRLLSLDGPAAAAGEQKSLLDLLRARSEVLRNVTVRQSQDPNARHPTFKGYWDPRLRHFGRESAPLLLSLLSAARCAGVAWGRTVAEAIAGIECVCAAPPDRPEGPLLCVATLGGMVGQLQVRAESSSSLLASRLAETLNGDWESLYTLYGVEAFLSYVDNSDEIPAIKKRIFQFPNYQAIFGGPHQPGVIDQLDAIITSCGNAHQFNQFWTTELPRLGVSPAKLNRLTYGNIGGVLLEKEGLGREDKALFDDIASRWMGISRRHYEQCARRQPGVILLAIGHNKAEVVLKCVELGLVTELIIDEELALALWDRVDPDNRYPRTLEAVLCRQVAVERTA